MKAIRWLVIALAIYAAIVVSFETLVVVMGKRQATRGLQPDEKWLMITTSDARGKNDTVVAGVESAEHLYVSTNHWPRGWYDRALQNPDVEVTRAGETKPYRAVPVTGEERARVEQDYHLPWIVRFLTGFPPRSFLRLDPR